MVCPAVIKMEGGTENDLRILEQPMEDEEERERLASAGPPSENQKREESRGAESDRKASTEKDDKEVRLLFTHTLVLLLFSSHLSIHPSLIRTHGGTVL